MAFVTQGGGTQQPDSDNSGVSDAAKATATEGDAPAGAAAGGATAGEVGGGGRKRSRGVSWDPSAALADIGAALRGELAAGDVGAVDVGGPGLPGPLQLLSERFIAAAARGDVDAVTELLDGGLVSPDVADSTGLTAIFAAAVRVAYSV